jgi:hypothetical protein
MVEDHHRGILGTTECVKLKLRLLAEDQKVVPISKQSTLKDNIIMFSVGGDIINNGLKTLHNYTKLLIMKQSYEMKNFRFRLLPDKVYAPHHSLKCVDHNYGI